MATFEAKILKRIKKFCAYQERSQKEVRDRLAAVGVKGEEAEELIAKLIEEGFLNEERFAKLYAGGKFRLKKWGKIKIKTRLQQKGISAYCIKKALEEINDNDYIDTLRDLIIKKIEKGEDMDKNTLKNSLYINLLAKGYESDLIKTIIEECLVSI